MISHPRKETSCRNQIQSAQHKTGVEQTDVNKGIIFSQSQCMLEDDLQTTKMHTPSKIRYPEAMLQDLKAHVHNSFCTKMNVSGKQF